MCKTFKTANCSLSDDMETFRTSNKEETWSEKAVILSTSVVCPDLSSYFHKWKELDLPLSMGTGVYSTDSLRAHHDKGKEENLLVTKWRE